MLGGFRQLRWLYLTDEAARVLTQKERWMFDISPETIEAINAAAATFLAFMWFVCTFDWTEF